MAAGEHERLGDPPTNAHTSIIAALCEFAPLRALIEPLDQSIIADLEAASEWFGISAGTVLFREGDPATDAFILLSGRLGVFVDAQPGQTPFSLMSPGELFGEMGLITGEPRSATVIALRDSDLVRLPKESVGKILRSSPDAMHLVLRVLTTRLKRASGPRASPRAIDSVAIVPLSDPIADARFVAHMALGLGGAAGPVEAIADPAAERGVQLTRSAEMGCAFRAYVADGHASAWARHCIRQADRVVFVANAGEPAVERGRSAIDLATELNRAADIVLVNPATASRPSGATAWLCSFASERILHVRAGNAADYGRVGRLICRCGIGLVFSGGGARGFAHIGVIKAFVEAGMPIDLVGGTSMGSFIAALLALDLPPDQIAARMRLACVESNALNDYTFPIVSLARGRKMDRLLRSLAGDVRVEDLWKNFFCMSSNLSTGTAVVHNSGLLWRALRASSAIPGLLPPLVENGQVLVDGGVMNNFPTAVMGSLRRGPVIGVDVAAGMALQATATDIGEKSLFWLLRNGGRRVPSIVQILMRAGTVNSEVQSVASRAAADLVIQPDLEAIDMMSFKSFDRAVEAGYRAGKAAIAEIDLLARGKNRLSR